MSNKILIVDDLHPAFKLAAEDMGFEVDDLPLIKKEKVLEETMHVLVSNLHIKAIHSMELIIMEEKEYETLTSSQVETWLHGGKNHKKNI